jgi:hypothetical protein
MRWIEHIARMVQMKHILNFGWETWKGRDHLEDLGEDGRISEWILGKEGGKVWTGCIWLRIGISGGLL